MEAGGEEKQRQTQNSLTSHCGEGEKLTRMEHNGPEQDRQQITASIGGKMSRPCAPPGIKQKKDFLIAGEAVTPGQFQAVTSDL
ncbi:hypothetical protein ACROYT_G020959 [Oculina patagonica]